MALNRKPLADAESPRTRQVWRDYIVYDFPSNPDDAAICDALKGLR